MKALIYLVSVLFLTPFVAAQDDCRDYLPDEGKKLTYINYDKKGKEQSTTTMEVRSVKETDEGTVFRVSMLVSTGKKKNDYEADLTYRCEEGDFFVDMQTMLNSEQMAAYKDASLVVESVDMLIPADLEPGMELDDGSIDVMVKVDYITTNITARAFYRKVLAEEKITVPAGTFTAWKIESNVESKFAFMRFAVRTVEWYVEDVGVVRSETYDNKNKMLGYTELQSIE